MLNGGRGKKKTSGAEQYLDKSGEMAPMGKTKKRKVRLSRGPQPVDIR